ncbi:lysozyme [Rhizobium sp. NZLR8]|uniref:lysozyme n=1 Tax=Rhizobium sp. NZLR8 TaxID=2731104 RepID=UPI001C83D12B|nr:lysozyme [Rhizobium sp. NZLR8]MBX5160414.1 lysozyme [Rhizobium sp. NZLR8]
MRGKFFTYFALIFAQALSVGAQDKIIPDDWVPSLLQMEQVEGSLPGAADETVPPRKVVKIAIGLIKSFEGWAPDVYDDPVGYCTIGWGHLIAKKRCATVADFNLGEYSPRLSAQKGNELLLRDTRPARATIQNLVKTRLNNRQFGALTVFVYNIGATNFSRSTMLKHLNTGRYDLAAREFRRWVHAKGVVLDGLVRRRNCEYELFRGNGTLLDNGKFDTSVCDSITSFAANDADAIDVNVGEVTQ